MSLAFVFSKIVEGMVESSAALQFNRVLLNHFKRLKPGSDALENKNDTN